MKKLISAILACVMVMTISAPQVVAAEKPQNINQAGQTEAFLTTSPATRWIPANGW